jgi:hypothetical protein
MLSIIALRTLVVLSMQSLQTSNLLKKTNETFADVRRILTIILVAPEWRDSARITRLCRGPWWMRILTKMKKGYMKGALGMKVP